MDTATSERAVIRRLLRPLEPIPTALPTRTRKTLQIKAVIFDIYGTLLVSAAGDVGPDSAEDDEQAFCQALVDGGWDPTLVKVQGARFLQEEILRVHQVKKEQGVRFPEVDILQIWQGVLIRLGLRVKEENNLRRAALSYECRTNPVWPMPGLKETLAELRARGMQLGLLSNAQFYTPVLFETMCSQSLNELGFAPEFCLFSYLEGEGKPASHLFSKLSSRLGRSGITASEILYVGNDMLKDIWPAAGLGWKTALFAGDNRSLRLCEDDQRVREVHPDLIIDDLRQLPEALR